MTWENDMTCRCGHSIDVHLSSCLVPDCACKRSMESIYDTEVARNVTESRRPPECCGVCPGIEGGGYDCTCEGNPRCPGPAPTEPEEKR